MALSPARKILVRVANLFRLVIDRESDMLLCDHLCRLIGWMVSEGGNIIREAIDQLPDPIAAELATILSDPNHHNQKSKLAIALQRGRISIEDMETAGLFPAIIGYCDRSTGKAARDYLRQIGRSHLLERTRSRTREA